MKLEVKRAIYAEIEPLRSLYRQEMNCQIVRDSILSRGLADPYLISVHGKTAGYGGVWNKYDKDRIMEFYVLPGYRDASLEMYRMLIATSKATSAEAQTNSPLMLLMLLDFCINLTSDTILFADAFTTHLTSPAGIIVRTDNFAENAVFEHKHEPVGDWAVSVNGELVATGGALFHYNPPYGDIYMEVEEQHRGQGYGSFLVQELKLKCYEMGKIPAARCGVANTASRRTLEKAGLLPCARILVGEIIPHLK